MKAATPYTLRGSIPHTILSGFSLAAIISLYSGGTLSDSHVLAQTLLSRTLATTTPLLSTSTQSFIQETASAVTEQVMPRSTNGTIVSPESFAASFFGMKQGSAPTIYTRDTSATAQGHVYVNLTTKTIELRTSTSTVAILPIVSVGKPGSYYETPGGTYPSDYKIKLHFSSIGHVYMPYSVHVFGNYFIHGIPYYEDGTRVSSQYSGGCIRLADSDAEQLYNFVSRGMPITIVQDKQQATPYSIREQTSRTLSAKQAAVIDIANGAFIYEKDSMSPLSSDEIRKYMLATVSLEAQQQDSSLEPPRLPDASTSTPQTTRRTELAKLISTGDPHIVDWFVSAVGDKQYTIWMNEKAKALALTSTAFTNAFGIPFTTTHDEALFLAYLYSFKSYLFGKQFTHDESDASSAFAVYKVSTQQASTTPIGIVLHGSLDPDADTAMILNDLRSQ